MQNLGRKRTKNQWLLLSSYNTFLNILCHNSVCFIMLMPYLNSVVLAVELVVFKSDLLSLIWIWYSLL